jgi:hypothetical protein
MEIFSFYLLLGLPSGLLPSSFPTKLLRNVGQYVQDYAVQHPRRQPSLLVHWLQFYCAVQTHLPCVAVVSLDCYFVLWPTFCHNPIHNGNDIHAMLHIEESACTLYIREEWSRISKHFSALNLTGAVCFIGFLLFHYAWMCASMHVCLVQRDRDEAEWKLHHLRRRYLIFSVGGKSASQTLYSRFDFRVGQSEISVLISDINFCGVGILTAAVSVCIRYDCIMSVWVLVCCQNVYFPRLS